MEELKNDSFKRFMKSKTHPEVIIYNAHRTHGLSTFGVGSTTGPRTTNPTEITLDSDTCMTRNLMTNKINLSALEGSKEYPVYVNNNSTKYYVKIHSHKRKNLLKCSIWSCCCFNSSFKRESCGVAFKSQSVQLWAEVYVQLALNDFHQNIQHLLSLTSFWGLSK